MAAILSNAVRAWIRRWADRVTDRYYEGPQPPARLAQMVVEFANQHPNATRAEWVRFACGHARECYRSGWTRGEEHAERDPTELSGIPEQLADALDPSWRERVHDWRWDGGITPLSEPDTLVPEETGGPSEIEQHLAMLAENDRRQW